MPTTPAPTLPPRPLTNTTRPEQRRSHQHRNAPGAIYAAGAIEISADFLDINGLVQSGEQAIDLTILSSFNPTGDTLLSDANGKAIAGVVFGTVAGSGALPNSAFSGTTANVSPIPVAGYFDAATQQIVLDPISPSGGSITLAGQILSTGSGDLVVANGYASVNIDNESTYGLVVNNVDTTKNRVGTVTITDTTELTQTVYTYNGGSGVTLQNYNGAETFKTNAQGQQVPVITYTQQGSNQTVSMNTSFQPTLGQLYVWVEGQASNVTTKTTYTSTSLNLVGNNVDPLDWLSNSWDSTDGPFVQNVQQEPLLQSQGIVYASTSNSALQAPGYAIGKNYSIQYSVLASTSTPMTPGTASTVGTLVEDVNAADSGNAAVFDKLFQYVGPPGSVYLPGTDFTNTQLWKADTVDPIPTANDAPNFYMSSFLNSTVTADGPSTSGGGWLRHTTTTLVITQTQGFENYYTQTLKADYPIAVTFLPGQSDPGLTITSKGDITLKGEVDLGAGGTVSLTTIDPPVNPTPSITIGNGVAIFGASADASLPVNIVSAGKVNIDLAGSHATVNIFAVEDINLVIVSQDNASSQLVVGDIVSLDGNVTISAAQGITAANSSTSVIVGNRVQLDSSAGGIGTSANTLDIFSNTLGSGGLGALASGDINLTQVTRATVLADLIPLLSTSTWSAANTAASNLELIVPDAWLSPNASVQSVNGSVWLAAQNGAILDGIPAGFTPLSAAQVTTLSSNLNGAGATSSTVNEILTDETVSTQDYYDYWLNYRDATLTSALVTTGVGATEGGTTLTLAKMALPNTVPLATGQEVIVSGAAYGAGASLQNGTYFLVVNGTTVSLATSVSDALANKVIKFTNMGTNPAAQQITVTVPDASSTTASVSATALLTTHAMNATEGGTKLTFASQALSNSTTLATGEEVDISGASFGGSATLTNGIYFAVVNGDGSVSLATSAANAQAGQVITFSNLGAKSVLEDLHGDGTEQLHHHHCRQYRRTDRPGDRGPGVPHRRKRHFAPGQRHALLCDCHRCPHHRAHHLGGAGSALYPGIADRAESEFGALAGAVQRRPVQRFVQRGHAFVHQYGGRRFHALHDRRRRDRRRHQDYLEQVGVQLPARYRTAGNHLRRQLCRRRQPAKRHLLYRRQCRRQHIAGQQPGERAGHHSGCHHLHQSGRQPVGRRVSRLRSITCRRNWWRSTRLSVHPRTTRTTPLPSRRPRSARSSPRGPSPLTTCSSR